MTISMSSCQPTKSCSMSRLQTKKTTSQQRSINYVSHSPVACHRLLFSFSFLSRHSAVGTKRETSLRISWEALRSLYGNTKRGSASRFPCQVSPILNFSDSQDDRFAAMQLNCYVRGWKRMSALTKWLDAPNQFPDYVLSPSVPPHPRLPVQRRAYFTKTPTQNQPRISNFTKPAPQPHFYPHFSLGTVPSI